MDFSQERIRRACMVCRWIKIFSSLSSVQHRTKCINVSMDFSEERICRMYTRLGRPMEVAAVVMALVPVHIKNNKIE